MTPIDPKLIRDWLGAAGNLEEIGGEDPRTNDLLEDFNKLSSAMPAQFLAVVEIALAMRGALSRYENMRITEFDRDEGAIAAEALAQSAALQELKP